jgi:transcriptional regulator with XRE-family HTH domain
MSIGKRIKQSRKEKNLTQTQLAKQVNVSSQVISNWEREYTSPNNDDIARLSKALEVSADFLIGTKGKGLVKEYLGRYDSSQEREQQEFLDFLKDPELSLWFKEISQSSEDQIEELRDFWEFIKNRKKKN